MKVPSNGGSFHRSIAAAKRKALANARKDGRLWHVNAFGFGPQRYSVETQGPRTLWTTDDGKRKNPATKSRTLTLKGFTGKVKQSADGTIKITGRGKRA